MPNKSRNRFAQQPYKVTAPFSIFTRSSIKKNRHYSIIIRRKQAVLHKEHVCIKLVKVLKSHRISNGWRITQSNGKCDSEQTATLSCRLPTSSSGSRLYVVCKSARSTARSVVHKTAMRFC